MHTPNVLWPALIGWAGQTDALALVRAILCRTLDANFREDACFDTPVGTVDATETDCVSRRRLLQRYYTLGLTSIRRVTWSCGSLASTDARPARR
jgi:hypothetical protein